MPGRCGRLHGFSRDREPATAARTFSGWTKTAHERPSLNAGPGFLPASGWDVAVLAGFEEMPPVGQTRRLLARVGLYDIDVQVFFGAANPSPAVLAAAREGLRPARRARVPRRTARVAG
jgi:hypothetical protein